MHPPVQPQDPAHRHGGVDQSGVSPAALVDFIGFQRRGRIRVPGRVVLLERGDPDAVAGWLASAWAEAAAPEDLASLALIQAPARWCLSGLALEGRHPPGYRYRVVLSRGGGLSLACWRRYAGELGWQRRCGPMPLRHFLRHRLAMGPAAPTAVG